MPSLAIGRGAAEVTTRCPRTRGREAQSPCRGWSTSYGKQSSGEKRGCLAGFVGICRMKASPGQMVKNGAEASLPCEPSQRRGMECALFLPF